MRAFERWDLKNWNWQGLEGWRESCENLAEIVRWVIDSSYFFIPTFSTSWYFSDLSKPRGTSVATAFRE